MEKAITIEKIKVLKKNGVIIRHVILGCLTDIMYGLYFEVESLLQKNNLVLKQQEKRAFNDMMSSVTKTNKLLLRYSQDFLGATDEEFEEFCSLSDDNSMVFKAFVNKWFKDKANQDKIMVFLTSLESSPIFKQDAEQLHKLVLNSIKEDNLKTKDNGNKNN